MLKVGIIGCGKIADDHAAQIINISNCEIVGVCDIEELMARQLAERFKVRHYFSDINEFLDTAKPDVVHITTPPQSHFGLGSVCLDAGCHVYIEKPFTLDTQEAEQLIKSATEKKLKIIAGHNDQFTHAARRMRELIKIGHLGGRPVHIESYYGYDLGDAQYVRAFLGDKNHWARKLPGQLLQNIISHGIARIVEFLTSDNIKVTAVGFTSNLLKSLNESEIIDELRVIINENNSTTAYFTFSSQMRPVLHQLRIFGPNNALVLDHDHQTLIKIRGEKYKSYIDMFLPPLVFATQYTKNSIHNIKQFVRNDFHMSESKKFLFQAFYDSITLDAPLPISHREILLTSRIMDDIFSQIYPAKS